MGVILLASCPGFALADHRDEAAGLLAGLVTRGPLRPVEGPGDIRSSVAVPGARIIVSTLAGQEIQSVTTDDQGAYTVSLPPGTYRVTMVIPAGAGFTKDLPATVTIVAGTKTRLNIRIDTGIR